MGVRRHIRLKILSPVAGENVGAKPTCVVFLGGGFACVATCPPACLHVTQRLGVTCYTLASTPPPNPNPKSYSRKREDNHHRERQSLREERK